MTVRVDEHTGDNHVNTRLEAFTDMPIIDFCVETKLTSSKGEARRLLEQNGIAVNGEKVGLDKVITETDFKDGELLIKKGKKTFLKVILG